MKKRKSMDASPPRSGQGNNWFSLSRTLVSTVITMIAAIIAYETGAQLNPGEVTFVFACVYGLTWFGELLTRLYRKPRR